MKETAIKLVDAVEDDEDFFEIEAVEVKNEAHVKVVERFLNELGVKYSVKTQSHIKVGHVNYYPTTRSVNLDGKKKFVRKGLDFLKAVLKKERLIK